MGMNENDTSNKISQRIVSKIEKRKEKALLPLLRRFKKWGIKPNQLTGIAFLFALISLIFLVIGNYVIFTTFAIINFIFDSIDGSYSRFLKISSIEGAFIDYFADHTYFFFVLIIFLYLNLTNPLLIGLVIGFFLYHELLFFILKELNYTKVPYRCMNIILISPILGLVKEILMITLIALILDTIRAYYYIGKFYLGDKK